MKAFSTVLRVLRYFMVFNQDFPNKIFLIALHPVEVEETSQYDYRWHGTTG